MEFGVSYLTVTGLFVPKTFRSQERNTNSGRFVPWTFRSLDDSFRGRFVPWTIRSISLSQELFYKRRTSKYGVYYSFELHSLLKYHRSRP